MYEGVLSPQLEGVLNEPEGTLSEQLVLETQDFEPHRSSSLCFKYYIPNYSGRQDHD